MNYDDLFEQVTGYTPMRWQARLFAEHFAKGALPSAVSVPTGLGKTAVMAVWLIALAEQMKAGKPVLPRRLVYVVDRRAVVDQATRFAEDLRANLGKPEAKELAAALGLGEGEKLPISTLRGQFVDNREWLNDPAKPAIIVGTVDMIGSRLLFEGYGVSRKMRPYHAGLLGADTLVLLDEAHLVPPFEALLAEIAGNVARYGAKDEDSIALVPKLQLLPLSATGRRQTAQPFVLEEKDFHDPDDTLVIERLSARKCLKLEELGDRKLEVALAENAWALAQDGNDGVKPVRVIVYCNLRDVAEKTKAELDKKAKGTPAVGRTELFVGARRVKERMDAEARLRDLGFLAGSGEQTAPAFLVATSAGEVGVDLDPDHMVCDLVAWERMVQRFGRVNRRGGKDRQAEIVVVHLPTEEPTPPKAPVVELLNEPQKPEKPKAPGRKAASEVRAAYEEAKAKYDEANASFKRELKTFKDQKSKLEGARRKYGEDVARYQQELAAIRPHRIRILMLKRLLKGNVSPEALRQLSERARTDEKLAQIIADASSPAPLRPALNRALVDAWAMTSLPEHTGRPEVAPWLRGWTNDDPQTTVAWRKHLPVRDKPPVSKKEIENFFEAAPVHASETLETETYRVMKWLQTRAANLAGKRDDDDKALKADDVVAMLLKNDGSLLRSVKLGDLLGDTNNKGDKKRLEDIKGQTLVMDARFGGLQVGLLKDDANDGPPTADDDNEWLAPMDEKPIVRFRIRILERGAEDNEAAQDEWSESLRFDLQRSADGEATRWLSVQKWRDTSNTEDDRAEGRPQALADHQRMAVERVRTIGRRLGLPDHYVFALCIAARLHDEGKRAKNWQTAFKAARDAKKFNIEGPLAKTRGPINQAVLGGYRHEFGSLPEAGKDEEFKKLSPELQDLVLHLIAAHHGYARPLIATEGCEDAPPSMLERAREVALRYARLQKRWGPWGLAWWESLLRAADAQASRANDEAANTKGND